ncbi:MAG: hypothetical protein H7Y17_16735 [Chlorobia bacterium]|nr:hypothetical protein [Fimbriimonadaceae bacterium]
MAKGLGNVFGQASWKVASDRVEAHISQTGAQVGPVTFDLGDKKVQPFHISPWHSELIDAPSLIKVLRGDFFCLPFGLNETAYGDEEHPVHGETANEVWTEVGAGTYELRTRIRAGLVRRKVSLRSGETNIYLSSAIVGMSGPMCFGNHAMLAFPSQGLVSASSFMFGQVFPGEFEVPAAGGYSSLKEGEVFQRLEVVPMANGSIADLSTYPAREGFEDLVMLVGDESLPFAWNAVVFPQEGYLWFCLRNPKVLRHTVLWHSNGGRHYAPWNGRHRAVLGIEDVTAYFHYGLAESCAPNPISDQGFLTCVDLDPAVPLEANTIMGVVRVDENAEHVEDIVEAAGGVDIQMRSGETIFAKVDLPFLK